LSDNHSFKQARRIAEKLAGKHSLVSELLLDTEDLVVLGEPVGAARRTGLDLAGAETADEVTDEIVLSLARAVRHHHAPTGSLGHITCLDRLGHCPDLVDFKQKCIAQLLFDASFDALRIGDEQVVTDDLNFIAKLLRHLCVRLEVILVERVFDADHRVLRDEVGVELQRLILAVNAIVLARLLAEVVCLLLGVKELGGSNIEANLDAALMSALLQCLRDNLKTMNFVPDLRCTKPALIADVTGSDAKLLL
jgi:hypothetical protein